MSHFPVIAWNAFIEHVRVNVNPLAADDHMKEVIQQLQLMGEVIYVKGSVCVDVIVLDPKWLSSHILGQLLSPDFTLGAKSSRSGIFSVEDLKSIPSWDQSSLESTLPILESLGLCAKVRLTKFDFLYVICLFIFLVGIQDGFGCLG